MKVLKSWGTAGEVVVNLVDGDPQDLKINEPVFIAFDGLPVPFFIEKVSPKGGRFIIKFEDVDTSAAAEELVGRQIEFSSDSDCEEEDSVIGMMVTDRSGNAVGQITDITDYAGNVCITVNHNGKDVLLPFHEDLILQVKKDKIKMEIPEGLL